MVFGFLFPGDSSFKKAEELARRDAITRIVYNRMGVDKTVQALDVRIEQARRNGEWRSASKLTEQEDSLIEAADKQIDQANDLYYTHLAFVTTTNRVTQCLFIYATLCTVVEGELVRKPFPR